MSLTGAQPRRQPTAEARREFFSLVVPILEDILDFGPAHCFVQAPTVHHFMDS